MFYLCQTEKFFDLLSSLFQLLLHSLCVPFNYLFLYLNVFFFCLTFPLKRLRCGAKASAPSVDHDVVYLRTFLPRRFVRLFNRIVSSVFSFVGSSVSSFVISSDSSIVPTFRSYFSSGWRSNWCSIFTVFPFLGFNCANVFSWPKIFACKWIFRVIHFE